MMTREGSREWEGGGGVGVGRGGEGLILVRF